MINSNLVHLIQFCESDLIPVIQAVKEIWSSEEWVRYNPTGLRESLQSNANCEIDYRVNTRLIMQFSARERLFFYKILRILKNYTEDPLYAYIIFDLTGVKRIYDNILEFSRLEMLSDDQFNYELDTEIMYHSDRFFGQYYQLYQKQSLGSEPVTIVTIFVKGMIPRAHYHEKKVPKRFQRHRGYRDHGSLGSEFSRTLKQQATDWSLRKLEEERIRAKKDLLEFLWGFGGWE